MFFAWEARESPRSAVDRGKRPSCVERCLRERWLSRRKGSGDDLLGSFRFPFVDGCACFVPMKIEKVSTTQICTCFPDVRSTYAFFSRASLEMKIRKVLRTKLPHTLLCALRCSHRRDLLPIDRKSTRACTRRGMGYGDEGAAVAAGGSDLGGASYFCFVRLPTHDSRAEAKPTTTTIDK